MDTNERFTRVYSTYSNNVIQGTRNTNNGSRYCQLDTFTKDIIVSLPPGIQKWAPIITSATQSRTSSAWWVANLNNTWKQSTDAIDDFINFRIGTTGTNVSNALYTATAKGSPIISAQGLVVGGGPIVRLAYTYMAHIRKATGDSTAYTERKATCSFIIVGY